MPLYRKKPVTVFAEQYTAENEAEVIKFIGGYTEEHKQEDGSYETDDAIYTVQPDGRISIAIKTLEGNMTVSEGDFVIQGVNGEFYPCKPDIFFKTYEEVERAVAALAKPTNNYENYCQGI